MMPTVQHTGLSPKAMVMAPLIWIGKIIFLIGFVTNYWYSVNNGIIFQHRGLWVICDVFICAYYTPVDSFIYATRALECMALICISVASFQSLIYLRRRVKERLIIGAISVTIGGFLGILGIIVFAAKLFSVSDDYVGQIFTLGYSYYLTVVGCVLALAGGPLMFLEYRSRYH